MSAFAKQQIDDGSWQDALRTILVTGLLRKGILSIRSRVATKARRLLARHDLMLLNSRSRLGIDYLNDIQRLAESWGYRIGRFFDVGAHVGETALAAFNRFPNVHVYSFEPHPSAFSLLEQRIEKSRQFNAENIALGITVGSIDMFEYGVSSLNSLVPDAPYAVRFQQVGRRMVVPCTTLSLYCQEKGIDGIDVLKVDTEGYDLSVLQGAEQMLANGAVKFVYVEFNDLHPREGATGGALLPMAEFLRGYGFRFVASYNDYAVTEGELFLVSNALFASPPPVQPDAPVGCEGWNKTACAPIDSR